MPKTRLESAVLVKAAYQDAKDAAVSTAALAARCTAVMVEQHASARVAPEVGAEAITLVSEATHHALKARDCMMRAHHLLKLIPDDLGIRAAFGPDETADDKPFTSPLGTLRVVGSAN